MNAQPLLPHSLPDRACTMRTDVPKQPGTQAIKAQRLQRALMALAFPWLGNEAVALSPFALAMAAILLLTALAAFALTWLLQSQVRKTRQLQQQLLAQQTLHRETLDALPFGVVLHKLDGQPLARNRTSQDNPDAEQLAVRAIQDDDFAAQ